jgi:hypothetical protein
MSLAVLSAAAAFPLFVELAAFTDAADPFPRSVAVPPAGG